MKVDSNNGEIIEHYLLSNKIEFWSIIQQSLGDDPSATRKKRPEMIVGVEQTADSEVANAVEMVGIRPYTYTDATTPSRRDSQFRLSSGVND